MTSPTQHPSSSWPARLRETMEKLRARVGWRERLAIALVALALTFATWGPMIVLPFGLSAPSWESFVHETSAPYCHQLRQRSFQLHGHVFPLCTRCSGMWIGITLGVAFAMVFVPRHRWWIGSGLAIAATAASAFDKLREETAGTDSPGWRFVLGILIFVGVTLAVSFDTLAILAAGWRALGRVPRALWPRRDPARKDSA